MREIKDMKYVVRINDGLWCEGNKNVFDIEEVKKLFRDEGIERFEFEEGSVDFDEGIKMLMSGFGVVDCYNEVLFEMGDDCCELCIEEVK